MAGNFHRITQLSVENGEGGVMYSRTWPCPLAVILFTASQGVEKLVPNQLHGGGVDLMWQLITDSLIKCYCGVLHNASVKIHQLMQTETGTSDLEIIHWAYLYQRQTVQGWLYYWFSAAWTLLFDCNSFGPSLFQTPRRRRIKWRPADRVRYKTKCDVSHGGGPR